MRVKIPHWAKRIVKNYYLMVGLVFVVWMLFFDSNNVMNQLRSSAELDDLLQQKAFYESETASNKALVEQLTNPDDKRALEKYGREKYLMKKDREEIFLIIPEDK